MKPLPTFSDLLERFPALQSVLGAGKLRQLPFVQQLTQTECGVACLAMPEMLVEIEVEAIVESERLRIPANAVRSVGPR